MPKRSDTSSASRKRHKYTYFTDECLGRIVPETLRAAGHRVELYLDHFLPGTPDVTWLPFVGRKRWILLTKDKRLQTRMLELKAVMESRVCAVVLQTRKEVKAVEIAEIFLKAMKHIESFLLEQKRPMLLKVTASADVTLEKTFEQWKSETARIKQ